MNWERDFFAEPPGHPGEPRFLDDGGLLVLHDFQDGDRTTSSCCEQLRAGLPPPGPIQSPCHGTDYPAASHF